MIQRAGREIAQDAIIAEMIVMYLMDEQGGNLDCARDGASCHFKKASNFNENRYSQMACRESRRLQPEPQLQVLLYTVKLQYVYVKDEPKNTNTGLFQTLFMENILNNRQ